MTVENIQNKMPPLQMGTTTQYPFTFAVLLQDPTEEEALKAIKARVLLADGSEVELVYETDYTVELNTNRIGGTVTVKNARTSTDYITIFREYEQTQEVDYRDFNSAPAETFEQCFDKLTMLSQQQQEQIDRSLKFSVSSTSINPSLPEPIANNTLIWNEEGTDFKNYDIIGENEQFKADVNNILEQEQADIQGQVDSFKTQQSEAFEEFKQDVNANIDTVLEAAGKVNELEDSVALAITSAEAANTAAQDAITAANNATTALASTANTDLSNLSEIGQAKLNEKLNKSGDTMSGNLEFVDNKSIYPYNSTLAIEDTPSTNYFGLVAGYADKNKARKSHIESYWKPDGARGICISEKKNSTENSYAQLLLGFDTEGQAFATAPASDNYESIVTTLGINKASNGYVKLGNGIILQWGVTSAPANSTSVTVTLPTSFSNTNYKVVANANAGSGYVVTHACIFVQVASASQFILSHQNPYSGSALSRWWFAIGY